MQKKVTLLRCTQNKQALTHSVLVKSRRPKRAAPLGAVSTAVPLCLLSAGPQRHTWGSGSADGENEDPSSCWTSKTQECCSMGFARHRRKRKLVFKAGFCGFMKAPMRGGDMPPPRRDEGAAAFSRTTWSPSPSHCTHPAHPAAPGGFLQGPQLRKVPALGIRPMAEQRHFELLSSLGELEKLGAWK